MSRYATKENACQAICHMHGADVQGYTVKCGWGRDESGNTGNNGSNYAGGMNKLNYNNNQYDSVNEICAIMVRLNIFFSILKIRMDHQ